MTRLEQMWHNLKLELADGYTPMQNLLIKIAVDERISYDEAVDLIKDTKINAPCFIVMANREDQASTSKYGQAIMIARGRETTDHTDMLSLDLQNSNKKTWIGQTNRDVWLEKVKDPRYNILVSKMTNLTSGVTQDILIGDVLDLAGVRTDYTIFSTGMSAQRQTVDIYKNHFLT